uniref:Uncharacterized protein n=1 Tax=Periophthalmus magnuspinnatus TaxID=409849 RepID=A0A3B4AFI9_9GOBI
MLEVSQNLVFSRIYKTPIVPLNAEYRPRGSLKYEFSTELWRSPVRILKMTDVKEQVADVLNHLVVSNRDKVHEDAPLKFLELIELLRASDVTELQWLMDAIPTIGTKAALEIVMDEILRRDMSVPEATQVLIGTLHMLEPTSEIIQKVWVSEHLAQSKTTHIHYKFFPQRIQVYFDKAFAEKNTQEIVLLAKVMANAHHPWSYKAITKLLPIHGTAGYKLSHRVHIEAILALRGIAQQKPKEVQNLALQLFMDKTLHPELRMLAIMALLEIKSSMAVMTNVVNVIKSDRSLPVISFTYSLIKSLSRSTDSILPFFLQNKFLGDSVTPAFVLILRAVRANNNKPLGYQIAAYEDRNNNRVQMIIAALAAEDNWSFCADAIGLAKNKAVAKLAWGEKCKTYDTMITAETGLVQNKVAVRVRLAWNRLPTSLVRNVKISVEAQQLSLVVVVESEKVLGIIVKSPARGELTTFSNKQYKNYMPNSCYQLMAQDCTDDLKFIVLMKKDSADRHMVNVKIGTNDIDMLLNGEIPTVTMNGKEIARDSLPYNKDSVKIEMKAGNKIVLYAQTFGITELHFSASDVSIRVPEYMRNRVCGLCGQGNGDRRNDYRMPSGRVTDNPISFAHSWTLSSQRCRLNQESIELERDITIHGVQSKCISVHPVLRCRHGCTPTRTTMTKVGFHCRPRSNQVSDVHERSIDMTESVEAHLDCSCTSQCT